MWTKLFTSYCMHNYRPTYRLLTFTGCCWDCCAGLEILLSASLSLSSLYINVWSTPYSSKKKHLALVIETSDELEDDVIGNCWWLYLSQVQVVVVTIIFSKESAAVLLSIQRLTVRNTTQYFTNRCRSQLPQNIQKKQEW